MVEAYPEGGSFITGVPQNDQQRQSAQEEQQLALRAQLDEMSDDADSGDEAEREDQYFQVDDAEPPTNYDDAYSTLPAKIKLQNIKKDITASVSFSESESQMKDEFMRIIGMQHFDALISDAFWYFICSSFKRAEDKPKYEAHNEFLLDRMAANYVSYTLVEDPGISKSTKEKFFNAFYNHLSQAVYHCLKTAFPKNRNRIEKADTKRDLLNTFSELFTGMVIQSAKFSNWTEANKVGAGGIAGTIAAANKQNGKNAASEVTLADIRRKGPLKADRRCITMRYSPLVERYLLTHKYETMNNVRGWKMLMTQRSEAQREADRKLKIYKQIAEQIETKCRKMDLDYRDAEKREAQEMEKVEKRARRHIKSLQNSLKEKMKNGSYPEQASLIVSMHCSNQQKILEGQNQ